MSEFDDRFHVPPPPPAEPPFRSPDPPAPRDPFAPQEPYVPPAPPSFAGPEGYLPAEGPGSFPAPVVTPSEAAQVDSSTLSSRIADELIAWLKTLASAAVYATLIVTFGFQVARVEGQSMAPTLQDQDRLIVNKFAYRIGEPQIGDIVMLYYPNRPEKSFVKRVIAAEGDQVRIIDGRVYRNDVLMDDSFVPAEYRSHEDWGPKIIDEGYYFVMGDHRNNSSDSRHWGYVPKKYIIGRVQLRWWPVPAARVF
ncbi:MAG: signal peptidase I [Acidobacteria bacterium]|nr:signal peptidase I [Acidobacteriota bacterium]